MAEEGLPVGAATEASAESDGSPESAPHASPAAGSDGTPTAAPRRRRLGRLGSWAKVALAALLGFSLAGAAFLAQTAPGQRLVLDEILDRVRGALAGELAVGGIRSQTLLAGFTLTNVRLDAEGGRPVLAADSVVLRYSLLSLLVGSPRAGSATLHGLALEISRGPADDALNVQRIFAPAPRADSATTGPPSTIELGRIAVRQGTVTVSTPATEPSRVTVAEPGGASMRRIAFENVDLDLEETILRPGGAVVLDARLGSFAATVHIVDEPVVVQAAVGDLTFGVEGIRVRNGAFRLPGSLLEGEVGFGPDRPGDAWTFGASLRADEWGDLADLRWIDERIAAGRFRGRADVRSRDGLGVDLRDFEVQSGASVLTASGALRFAEEITYSQLVVTATPLATSDLDSWITRDIPFDGFVSGQATLSGSPSRVHVDGRMTLVPTGIAGAPTTADISGTILTGADPGAEDLDLRLDPVNYRVLGPYWAGASELGEGRVSLTVDGRADEGLLVVADVTHADATGTTRVFGDARFQRDGAGEWSADARGDLAPLQLDLVGRFREDLGLRGSVSGPVRLAGPLSELGFEVDLRAGDGRLTATGSLNATSVGAAYALETEAEAVNVTAIIAHAPEPSVVSGHLSVRGSGLALDALEGFASLELRPSRLGPLRITSVMSDLRARSGLLLLDSVAIDISGARIGGSGTLGLTSEVEGEASFAFAIDSLGSLRPMLMGDSILVRDGLSPLEEDLLRVRGIEPDTLPTELDVRMAGSARGTADVRGHIRDMAVQMDVGGRGLAYRHDQLDSASVALSGRGLPDFRGDWRATVRASGVVWEDRRFDALAFDGTMSQRRGEGTLDVVRRLGERYFVTGAFALDSLGGQVALSEATVQIDDFAWLLDHPGGLAWDSANLRVDTLELRRLGEDPGRVRAHGTLTRGGESDFVLDLEGFHVEDASRILQREDVDISGHVDLTLTVTGPAESPTIGADFAVQEPRYGALGLDRLGGSVEYRDRSAEFRVDAWDLDRNVLSGAGALPIDLALVDVEARALDEPMDVRITAESLDASIALAYFGTLEEVAGTISANLQIGGTTREPQPSGTISLVDGGWTISALGVRHTGVSGELELRSDRTIGVRFGTGRAGRSTVSGVVTMAPFTNPTLDLLVTLDQFQAVSRRDIESTLSGSFTVRGEYRLPVAEGALRVDEGTLFVDEFARSVSVVDLRDPTLFSEGFAVDTTVFVTQPILASLRNPFLDNLRVDIDLSVPRNLWLRSTDMNVEMGGELLVRYDRAVNDLVMVGDLQALRGSYEVLGRTFEVDGGAVSFLGQPGVNPALGIQALSRVRRRGGDRLEVRATVTGTLVQPLVTLSTTEAGLTQSDLVSYLLFGAPSGELNVGGAGGGGTGFDEGLASGLGTYFAGAVASQVGTAIAQEIGFDYLAVSRGDVLGDADVAENFFSTTQFEVGRYLGEDIFVVFVLGDRGDGAGGGGGPQALLRGVRVELALSEEWFVEGFAEDRFLRGAAGLGQTGLGGKVFGMLIFRDWGYGSQ